MGKKTNRQLALNQYLEKWGMSKYKFILGYRGLYVSPKNCVLPILGFEIRSLHTLLKNIKSVSRVILKINEQQNIEFDSFDEFKHHTLIEKLGFKNYG